MHLSFWLLLPLFIVVNASEIERFGILDDVDHLDHQHCKGIFKGKRKNEFHSKCAIQECQDTCLNPTNSLGCTGKCKHGCICAEGFIRNSVGECVLPLNCDVFPTCAGMNEVFSYCGNDGCQPTCDNVVITGCIPRCGTPACVCATGFVRNPDGVCVLPEMCPCPAGEVFNLCGCEGTCDNPDTAVCITMCPGPRCVCRDGFVRNNDGVCIMEANCPTTCPAGEIFSMCGQDGCEPTCNNPDTTGCIPMCTTPSCICETGLVRDMNGNCIAPGNCPPNCAQNEVFSMCGNNDCQITCADMDPTGCNNVCTPGCICAPGFLRRCGVCVPQADCRNCPQGERYRTCGRGECESTCEFPDLGNDPNCDNSGTCDACCFCIPGFIRDITGSCVNGPNAVCIMPKFISANTTRGI